MAGENNLWHTVQRRMKQDSSWVHFQRHEDTYSVGIADTSFVIQRGRLGSPLTAARGWMELKHAKEWPKRATTTLKLRHFTVEQRNWLRRQGELGGRTWLLLQVARDYMLFHWKDIDVVGNATHDELFAHTRLHSLNHLAYTDLINILSKED